IDAATWSQAPEGKVADGQRDQVRRDALVHAERKDAPRVLRFPEALDRRARIAFRAHDRSQRRGHAHASAVCDADGGRILQRNPARSEERRVGKEWRGEGEPSKNTEKAKERT